jgi:prepilin-type processing-associated H-X9-DG protein
LNIPQSGPGATAGVTYRHGSYRGMSGISSGGDSGKWFDLVGQSAGLPASWKGPLHVDRASASEKFGPVSLAGIPDGTSNTILAGERYNKPIADDPPSYKRSTFWAYSYGSYNTSSAVPDETRILQGFEYIKCKYPLGRTGGVTLAEEPCMRSWGSNHSNIVNFVFCDGSVRSLNSTLSPNILVMMATIAGGEVIPNF